MDSKDNDRVLLLEEEVKNLSEELAQCQVYSLGYCVFSLFWGLWDTRLVTVQP